MIRKRAGLCSFLLAAIVALLAVSLPATATAKDRNKDRIPDRWEKTHKLSLKKDQRKLDQDRDGLKNRGEWLAGFSPRDRDSDDDGTIDAKENAGFVASWDPEAGDLTITLYAGGSISGLVTDATGFECYDEGLNVDPPAPGESSSRHDDDSGDNGTEDDDSGDNGTEDDDEGHNGTEDDDQGHQEDDGDCGDCSAADLAVGVEIQEADVRFSGRGPVFTNLEIENPVAAG